MEHILSLSYGKDSLACLGAIEELGWPLERIVTAEVYATDTIPADLPPMMEFKQKADAIIRERWGIEVEHVCATMKDGALKTYETQFNRPRVRKKLTYKGFDYSKNTINGFPTLGGAWCNRDLKVSVLEQVEKGTYEKYFYKQYKEKSKKEGQIYGFPISGQSNWCNSHLKMPPPKKIEKGGSIVYIGIAADEPSRFHNLTETKKSPLVEAGWTEAMCRTWCEKNDLLSPIYSTATRGGCWFCHNQSVDQLRLLRHNYPELWALLLKWDSDSPVTFHADGHTVHDFDKRFELEDKGFIGTKNFRWQMLKDVQYPLIFS